MKAKKGIIKKSKLQKKIRVRTKIKNQSKIKKEENLKAKKKIQSITKEDTSKIKARPKTQAVKQIEAKFKVKSQAIEQVVSKPKSIPRKFAWKSTLEEQVLAENKVTDVIEMGFFQKKKKYMDKEQQACFRKVLLNWKEKLTESAAQYKIQEDEHKYCDSLDSTVEEDELDAKLCKHNRKRNLLQKIEEDLIRIDNNSYGYCCDCGAKIGRSHLDVNPIAIRCIDCKSMVEVDG